MDDGLMARLLAQAARFVESGAEPAEPRLAATVMLLRQAPEGLEVFLLRRAVTMVFASGMYAYPGGSVDPADYEGPPLGGDWAMMLGRPEPEASAVVRAAVREVAEEIGVRLDAGRLLPWTRWITPEFEPRRYDTYFFVSALPERERPRSLSAESDHICWLRPAVALAQLAAGEIAMFPPTSATLTDLAGYDTVEAALAGAAGRDAATPVLPRLEREPDGTTRFVS